MARIRTTITGLGKNFSRTQAIIIQKLSDRQIEAMARETEVIIQKEITKRIEREDSTGNLANNFTTVKIPGGWGVGDISLLNQNAPYWFWQNFGRAQSGRTTPPPSAGAFKTGTPQPISAGGNSRWGQPGQFFINPSKPITPKNYIAATVSQVNQIVASVVRRIRS